MIEHWLVLGGTSSIARAFVRQVAAAGAYITVAGRDTAELHSIAADAKLRGATGTRVLQYDALDATTRAACVVNAPVAGTRLNILVTVGSMPEHEAMQADATLMTNMMQSTYVDPAAMLEGLAPVFKQQESGRIVVVGSVAGDRGRYKNYLYGSAKAGLATYTEGLRAQLFKYSATVTLVKPGFIDTPMTWGLPGLFLVASPQDCARSMLRAAERGKAVIYFPGFWRFIMLLIQHIPHFVLKRLVF